MLKLYHVSSLVPDFHGRKDVEIAWFRHPSRPLPTQDEIYPEYAIGELFTEDEAAALKQYLDREHGDSTTIRPANNTISNVPVVGRGVWGTGVLWLDHGPRYNLPFAVRGYYDTRHCERVAPITEDEITRLPGTKELMTEEEFNQWRATRKAAGEAIDIETCELAVWHADDAADPYGRDDDREWYQAGKHEWVRSPESRG
jgi:hypothetical protein